MSHRWGCPTDHEARRKARDDVYYDFNYGHGRDDYRRSPYDCDEGNRAYRREYEREAYVREEEAAEERRRERRRQERLEIEAAEQAYWDAEWRRQEEEREQQAWEEWLYFQPVYAAAEYQGAAP